MNITSNVGFGPEAGAMCALLSVDIRVIVVAEYFEQRMAEVTRLRMEDMQSDIDRLITKMAGRYVDDSCVFLHRDELEAEGRMAVYNVVRKNWLTRARSRVEFFKITKAAINNRIRSIVQQHRFTQKRTGVKPPARNEITWESHRPNEVSFDDPNAHVQVGEPACAHDIDATELEKEIRKRLEGVTLLVFDSMLEIPLTALRYAEMEAARGRNNNRSRIKVTEEHIAAALKIPVETYLDAVLEIQNVTRKLQSMSTEDQKYEAAVAVLAEVFNLQVPKSTPEMLIRRMFTMAAFSNVDKVTQEVSELMDIVGARVPKYTGVDVSCFGVLYQEGHRTCESCGIRESCATQAANAGLGTVVYSHKAIGARATRTAFILPMPEKPDRPPHTASWRDSEIADYLHRNFNRVTHQGETYYRSPDFKDKSKLLFCIGTKSIPFCLRFCNPSQELRARLSKKGRLYFAPEEATAEEVVKLINEHAKNAYAARITARAKS